MDATLDIMRRAFFVFAIILALILIGGSYVWLKNDAEVNAEIKTGAIQIDYVSFEELQRQVDQGHQPWRLDPLLVAESEVLQYGFTAEDIQTLSFPPYSEVDLGTQITKLEGRITHEGKTYLITIGQPFVGKGKIWTILGIRDK
ncbi:MAG TPA: hypothetical protein VJC15_01780 [Candidatus Paceibacterota bacterium]